MKCLPPEAPAGVRASILEALKEDAYFIYPDGRTYLERKEFVPEEVVLDVIGYLEDGCRLYQLFGSAIKDTKYQCCLRYDDETVVHVKLKPTESADAFFVVIGFHSHNTGYPPLPC